MARVAMAPATWRLRLLNLRRSPWTLIAWRSLARPPERAVKNL
jgi:hypothetical protein